MCQRSLPRDTVLSTENAVLVTGTRGRRCMIDPRGIRRYIK